MGGGVNEDEGEDLYREWTQISANEEKNFMRQE